VWTKKTVNKNPMIFATKAYFDMNPYECWQRSYIFYNRILENKPNISHHSIMKMQEKCLEKNILLDLVTQNIDGYHADLIRKSKIFFNPEIQEGKEGYGHTNGLYEIHGNVHYMRCSLEGCSNTFLYKRPPVYNEYDPPRCKKCNNFMRINGLYFDETYNEKYYKSYTVLKKAAQSDLLIIVGTELKTSLPKKILYEHMNRQKPVIEFNLKPWVREYSNVISLLGPCEVTLPEFIDKYIANIANLQKFI